MIELLEHRSGSYVPRTILNATSAHLTVALAIDYATAGERLTSNHAGSKYAAIPLQWDDDRAVRHFKKHLFEKKATRINIAGNGIYTLYQQGITQRDVNFQMHSILKKVTETYTIEHIRSGGQTGVDFAGLVAGIVLGIPVLGYFPACFRQRDEKGNEIYQTKEDIIRKLREQVLEINPNMGHDFDKAIQGNQPVEAA